MFAVLLVIAGLVLAAGQQVGVTLQQIQRLDNLTSVLDRKLQEETSARRAIEHELQQKNDVIQFLQTDVTSMKAIIQDLQQKLVNLESNVTNRAETSAKPEVAFSAKSARSRGTSIFSTPYFDHVTTNTGNNFSPGVSSFTCPIEGLYLFTATIQKTEANISLQCSIRMNGATLALIEVHDEYPGNPTSSTNSVIVRLAAGDMVALTRCTGDADFNSGTTFSGVLL